MESRERVVKALNKLIKALAVIWLVLIVLRLIWYFADIAYVSERITGDSSDGIIVFFKQIFLYILFLGLVGVILPFFIFYGGGYIPYLALYELLTIFKIIVVVIVAVVIRKFWVVNKYFETTAFKSDFLVYSSKKEIALVLKCNESNCKYKTDEEFYIFKRIVTEGGEEIYLPYSVKEDRYVDGYVIGKNIWYHEEDSGRKILIEELLEEKIVENKENKKEQAEERINEEILAEKVARAAIKLLKLRRQEKTIVSCCDISPIYYVIGLGNSRGFFAKIVPSLIVGSLIAGIFVTIEFTYWLIQDITNSSRITVLKIIWIMSMLLMVMLLAIFVVKGFYERGKKDEEKLSIEIVKIPMILYRENKKAEVKEGGIFVKDEENIVLVKKGDKEDEELLSELKIKKERVEGLYEVRLISKNSSDEEVKSTLGCWVRIDGEA
ncbi:hypothetical protein [Caldicellulosiruptor naganoensis]|uniref:Uncharacterized protein n=1 Tax=Caldicellulosiruptor naganoensis TaxID=29324 RepID=A0ABY7BJA5_9FIRM|nr:hypothetical protein [Caldicellulosiruptor naganoensis]WAM31815.1 hypothetical protein OTJ99_000277 [Caldicellulosiruptor naganoensis]